MSLIIKKPEPLSDLAKFRIVHVLVVILLNAYAIYVAFHDRWAALGMVQFFTLPGNIALAVLGLVFGYCCKARDRMALITIAYFLAIAALPTMVDYIVIGSW